MARRRVVLLTPPKSPHPTQLLSRQHSIPVSPLAATLMNLLASIAYKRLTAELSPLDSALTKNRGVGCALNSSFSPSTFNLQLSTSSPSRDLSSQPLTNCPPHNLFLLTSLQMSGGIGDRVQEFLKHYFNSAAKSSLVFSQPSNLQTCQPLNESSISPATIFHPWLANASASISSPISTGAKKSPAPFASLRIPPCLSRAMTNTAGS